LTLGGSVCVCPGFVRLALVRRAKFYGRRRGGCPLRGPLGGGGCDASRSLFKSSKSFDPGPSLPVAGSTTMLPASLPIRIASTMPVTRGSCPTRVLRRPPEGLVPQGFSGLQGSCPGCTVRYSSGGVTLIGQIRTLTQTLGTDLSQRSLGPAPVFTRCARRIWRDDLHHR
jgi:hypothetical protein